MKKLLPFLVIIFPILAQAQLWYTGDASCVGGMCHNVEYWDYKESGHPHQLYHNNGNQPSSTVWPFTEVPPLPSTFGIPVGWSFVHYVIGNYYWKTLFVDLNGSIITGIPGDSTQWNVQTQSWGEYHPGEMIGYDCGRCHTTGYDPEGNNPLYPQMTGSWVFDGVQCEACHGPCSSHCMNPFIPTPGGLDCDECHYRDPQQRLIWKDGFILDQQEAVELETGGMADVECIDCHDQHKSTVYNLGGIPYNFDCSSCDGHSPGGQWISKPDGVMEDIDCIECHMPYMDRSATTENEYKADVRSHIYGILPAAITREENIYQIGDTTFWQVDPFLDKVLITLDYACLGCHVDNGYPITMDEAADMAAGFHSDPLVSINIDPEDPPVRLPAEGGDFHFTMEVLNNESYPISIDYWAAITDTTYYIDTLIMVEDVLLQPGEQILIDTTGWLPGDSPGGLYHHRAYVREHVYQEIYDFDVFLVYKNGSVDVLEEKSVSIPSKAFYSAPNPFNAETKLTFNLQSSSEVNLTIYDIRGRTIAELLDEELQPGLHQIAYDAGNLGSGVYIARLVTDESTETTKLVLIR